MEESAAGRFTAARTPPLTRSPEKMTRRCGFTRSAGTRMGWNAGWRAAAHPVARVR
jgi:hypothetical protein